MERIIIEHIKPFVLSLAYFFKTMLDCEPRLLTSNEGTSRREERRVISVIGLSGTVRGTVSISMPIATAQAMVSKFIGMDVSELDDTLIDAVAEIGNIIAGGAKTRLGAVGQVDLSLPNVVICKGSMIFFQPSTARRTTIQFTSPVGDFDMLVTLEKAH